MKIRASEIASATTSDEGILSVGIRNQRGEVHTIEFGPQAQQNLALALLASGSDPRQPASRRLRPVGLGRFQIDQDVGLSLFLAPRIAIHVVLTRSLAKALQEKLETFDDPSTWKTDSAQ
jgi:hypothetical protein